MILSENRFPSPIGVEDMLFGIMRLAVHPLGFGDDLLGAQLRDDRVQMLEVIDLEIDRARR